MPRAERFIKNIPEGKGHYVGKIHFHTGDWPFRDGFVFPVVPMQKQPDAVPRPVCFLSVLHHPSADAGGNHRGNQLCAEHGSFLLPGEQKPLSERENHVRRTVRHAGGSADFHLGRLVVDSAGAANIAATVGGYTYNPRKIRLVGMLVNSPLWIIYDGIIGSWAGILDEIVTEVSMIVSIFRYGWENLDSVSGQD